MSPSSRHGLLESDRPLTAMNLAVDVGFAILLVVCGARYFSYHPFADGGAVVLALAIGAGLAYAIAAIGPAQPARRRFGVLAATILWLPLTIIAPSFGWCAFALFFAVHRVLRRTPATIVSCIIVAAVSVGLFLMSRGEDMGLVLGPLVGGLVLSLAYDALDRAMENRRLLIDELVDARSRLDLSQREAGALAERNRVASELHDTVVQRTASALLLLESAEQRSERSPAAVGEAREVLREALVETRQLLHGLERPRERRSIAETLDALTRENGAALSITGDELELDDETTLALVRVAQEALVNVGKHAGASTAHVTLTFFDDAIGIDVADNGTGFDADRAGGDGYGLRAMRWRIESLGGSFTLESAPGHGTVVGGVIPLPSRARGTE